MWNYVLVALRWTYTRIQRDFSGWVFGVTSVQDRVSGSSWAVGATIPSPETRFYTDENRPEHCILGTSCTPGVYGREHDNRRVRTWITVFMRLVPVPFAPRVHCARALIKQHSGPRLQTLRLSTFSRRNFTTGRVLGQFSRRRRRLPSRGRRRGEASADSAAADPGASWQSRLLRHTLCAVLDALRVVSPSRGANIVIPYVRSDGRDLYRPPKLVLS